MNQLDENLSKHISGIPTTANNKMVKIEEEQQQQQQQQQPDSAVAKCGEQPADFETAIDAAGFGMFNILLLLVAVFAAMATVYETSTMSYILPSAECDLKLSLLDKGILNAITYAGMISSAIFWGYVADTKGRKKLLIFGYVADTICVVGCALSQNVVQLLIFKYLGGFIMSGPFAVLMTYLTEFHGRQYRQRIMMMVGIMFCIGTLSLPGLAMGILPLSLDINIWGLSLHAWQVFVAITAMPSILSCAFFPFFPESPKFLMSQGRNQEALEAFKFIYALNTRQPRDAFPIKQLANEVPAKPNPQQPISDPESEPNKGQLKVAKSSLHSGLLQLRPLFVKPYLSLSLMVYLLNFCVLLGQNTIRLWMPQLFASITEYDQLISNQLPEGSDGGTSICNIVEFSVNRTRVQLDAAALDNPLAKCSVNISAAAYTNNLIVASAGLVSYILAGFLVNLVGVKRIMCLCLFTAGSCSLGMYWSSTSAATVALASGFVTMGSIAGTSLISASLGMFPTALRTMIVSLSMMVGRMGSLSGNIFFPALMSLGCLPPFLMVSFFMFFACLLGSFLPVKNKAILK
ncbi:synaptic vesicle glycoprotein 2C [Drosophila grimshawi]|uniref:GH12739 n=1 Tax=Drosophila grimshawi TaxID=7222 RepID=B4JKV4_DROGR|nr:synaptic vesicle glycoprotein 2C [Drosophila grimshawi]EDW00207.1 GH12739 [Drosophila grimshawi]